MIRSQISYRAIATLALVSLVAGCSGGGSPNPTPTYNNGGTGSGGSGSTGSTTGSAYTCPTTATGSSVAQRSSLATSVKKSVRHRASASIATGMIGVTYAGELSSNARSLALSRENAVGAGLMREMTFSHINRYERILHVTPGTEAQALAALRTQPGVIAASITGTPRYSHAVSQKYYTNDPYYNGFTAAQTAQYGLTATYHIDPYEENSGTPGQWGMHAVRLDYAQAYSQNNNGSGITNTGALGSSNVKLAVIDSGVDSNHPELSSKIPIQRCFITNGNNVQSTGSFSSDPDGHGTNVAGVAAATSNNSLGFVGTGGDVTLAGYRVFPTPDDSCVIGGTTTKDAQCGSNSLDIVSAINDAVMQKVNVINLSLGGDTCSNGVDSDTTEGNAVLNALNTGIVVVASAGNAGVASSEGAAVNGVDAPACISGVIAVGASALSDGVATGTSTAPTGSASSPVEYVASYSQYGSPSAAVNNANAWGIVAPGGDPSNADATSTTTDQLHWIQNIWTTTPYDSNFAAYTSPATSCSADFGTVTGTTDCNVLIAGTSQASPTVAGAVALLIAANPTYATPTKMKQLLCSTAHDINDSHEGCGRLDIYRAMATALGDTNLPASK